MSERTVSTSSLVALPAATVVGLLRRPETVRYVCWPLLRIGGGDLPSVEAGASVEVPLTLLGLVPLWRQSITIVEADEGGQCTEERGGPVRYWRHRLSVEPVDATTAFYRDEVRFDAGLLTVASVPLVRGFYRWRHRRWARLARWLGRP